MKKIKIGLQTRVGVFEPKSFDEDKRTIDIVWTTGAHVERFNIFDGPFIEELGTKKSEVRLGALNRGAPFLDSHRRTSVHDILGKIEENSANMVNGQGRATVHFSKREAVKPVIEDIRSGIISGISTGYIVHKFKKVGERDTVPIMRAVDWEPKEVSALPIGAEEGTATGFRSENAEKYECIIEGLEERSLPPENKTVETQENLNNDQPKEEVRNMLTEEQKKAKALEDKKALDARNLEIKKQATADEKLRQSDIRYAVRSASLDDKFAEEHIKKDTSVDQVRTLIIDQLAKKNKEKPTNNSVSVEVTNDEHKTRMEGFQEALLHRHNSAIYKITDNGKQYRNDSLLDMARMCLEIKGIKHRGLSKMQMVGEAMNMRGLHASTDFPLLLENIVTKTLRDAYEAAPQTFAPFTRSVTAPDFKTISRVQLGDAPDLLKVPEGGEIKRGTIGEAAEKYNVADFARIIGISRKLIINDDLGAFTRLSELMGRAARDLESDAVWDIIKTNANLSDGFALYSSQHGNLGTAGVISDITLNEARSNMRLQVGLNGRLLNLQLGWIWVPTTLETQGEKQLAATQPQETSKVNPFGPQGRTPLQMIVEPRLDDGFGGSNTSWYSSSTLDQIDMVELARLQGEEGPVTQSREGFDVLGMEISIRHAIGTKAIDFRGLQKNPN